MVSKKLEKEIKDLNITIKLLESNNKYHRELGDFSRARADDYSDIIDYLIGFILSSEEASDFLRQLIEKVREENEGETKQ